MNVLLFPLKNREPLELVETRERAERPAREA